MSWSSFSTPFSVMVSFGMGSSMCLVVCGMAVDGFKLLDQYVGLTVIFQKSIYTGRLPEDWLSASISCVYKKGDKHASENYRPVSLTSAPGKLLNCWINMSSFSLLSLTSFPLLFNGETPMLSFFLDFMYFQNGLVLLDFSPFSMVSFIYVHLAFLICFLISFCQYNENREVLCYDI
jgi:hypothetical protein